MGLTEQIAADIKDAMKRSGEGDAAKARLDALRMLTSELKYKKIEKKADLEDGDVIDAVNSMVKKRRESAKMYTEGGRPELAAKELAEVEALQAYLPAQMDEAGLAAAVDEAVTATGAATMKDMGKVMGILTQKLKGRAEPARISAAVKAKLG